MIFMQLHCHFNVVKYLFIINKDHYNFNLLPNSINT